MERSPRRGALVGAASATVIVGLMFGLRLTLGIRALPDIAADAMTLVLPGGVFGFLIDRLQELGRPLMLVGLSLGLVLLGAIAGAATARFVADRSLLVRIVAPTAGLCALTLPVVVVGAGDLAAEPALTTIAYWSLFAVLLNVTLSRAAAAPLVTTGARVSRRALLYGGAAMSALWLGSYLGGRFLTASEKVGRRPAAPTTAETFVPATPVPPGATAAPPNDPFAGATWITTTKDFYVISKNGVDDPVVNAATWRLQVGGDRPYAIGYDELKRMEFVEFPQTLACISNNVGGPLISTAVFRGVRLRDLLDRAGMPATAREIRFNCADGYTESIPIETANEPQTIVVYLMNGEPIPKEHGFPARILMSGRYGMKNPKWVTAILPVAQPYNGYWEQRGWSKDAFVRTMSRLDLPPEGGTIPTGSPYPLIRGVAYAGARGISRVEISFDGGKTWDETTLRKILPKDNWTPFTYVWTPPAPGVYTIVVRATDGEGQLQDPTERDSFPEGATGYHGVSVNVV
jgi:DMSO/TMAO reductase YedYZ molybdopterin-dependent catalytic subunit